MTRDERAIQEFIERELAQASGVEPVSGLEGRLLAKLNDVERRGASRAEPRRWWIGGAALAAAAAIALAIFIGRQPAEGPAPQVARSAVSANQMAVTTPPAVRQEIAGAPAASNLRDGATARVVSARPAGRARRATPAAAPRPATFPSPAPLSQQEQLLLALATSRPKQAAELAAAQQQPVAPLQIEEIVIAPLETSGND